MVKVTLASSDLKKSLSYWVDLLGMQTFSQSSSSALLGFAENHAKLELNDIGNERCHFKLMYANYKCLLLGEKVDHCKAFGRIAFSCPADQLPAIESAVKEAQGTILTPLISLDTPGKATVVVVILADPVNSLFRRYISATLVFKNTCWASVQDGHEICFVGDEAFRELSRVDPEADRLLNEAISQDKSDEWFTKKGLSKAEA